MLIECSSPGKSQRAHVAFKYVGMSLLVMKLGIFGVVKLGCAFRALVLSELNRVVLLFLRIKVFFLLNSTWIILISLLAFFALSSTRAFCFSFPLFIARLIFMTQLIKLFNSGCLFLPKTKSNNLSSGLEKINNT